MLQEISPPAAGADDAVLHLVVGRADLLHGGSAVYGGNSGCHRGHRSGGLHEIAAGDMLVLGHGGHLFCYFPRL